jgi:WD40 repeat protein
VVTGGDDGTTRVWDAATGKLISAIPLPKGDVTSVAFDRVVARLLTLSTGDQAVHVFRREAFVPFQDLLVEAHRRLEKSGPPAM